jgi:hypothetical protein
MRDVGSAPGDTNLVAPRRNRLDSFERHPLILDYKDDPLPASAPQDRSKLHSLIK